MSFLNPAFLGALALIGIPLLIHLIRRRKLKVVRWAAMEFLRQSQRKQRRRLRIEELILLFLRMLIVAVAVLAFARPVLKALGVPMLSQNTRVYAVIVLDNSFSMAHKSGDGKSSWERAQSAAEDIVKNVLKTGDSVSLVLLSDKPEVVINSPSFNLNLVRERIRAATVTDRTTDYLTTAQMVGKLLKASKNPVKEVYWLSDDQADAWASSKKDSARNTWTELGQQARLTWISVGADANHRDNLAVETPTLGRELVTPHLPARIESRVINYGSQPRNNVFVNLIVDGKQVGTQRVSVPSGQSTTASFVTLFSTPGTHTGQVTLGDQADGLTRDNAAPFVIRSRERIRVLVQDIHPAANPNQSESFYLLTAMAPSGAAESLTPKLREGEGLGSTNLRDFDTVVITGLGGLSSGDRRALLEYVKAGGGLLLFPGPTTEAHRIDTEWETEGLLPAKLGERRALTEENAITLNPATATHPSLLLFKDTSSMNLGSARFTTYYPLEPLFEAADPNAVQVMLRFSNGDPAFVEKRLGLGKIVMAASSAGTVWNQLPLKPSYVPLVYQLVSYLGQGSTSHRNLRQDEPLFLSLPLTDANKPVKVTSPDKHTSTQNSALDARGVTFSYASTQQAGVYQVAVPGSKTTDAFAVGLPTSESNLAYSDPTQAVAQAGLPINKLTVARNLKELHASVNRSRYGTEVWRPFIWVVLFLLFLESFLAQLFGRRG